MTATVKEAIEDVKSKIANGDAPSAIKAIANHVRVLREDPAALEAFADELDAL